jgi:hypothetical protein
MKKISAIIAGILLFSLSASIARADQLDDMIARLRRGGTIDPNKLSDDLSEKMGNSQHKAFEEAAANLYVQEIKLSIVAPKTQGGWPYRSFLVEDDASREMVTDTLTARFKAKPDSILAFALICPALYAGDESKVKLYESYLKGSDPFLYDMEQKDIKGYWRKGIADELRSDDDNWEP